ncbi:MAG: 3'-5' exonuclease, partial [Syntrophales bacterium]|nr:3'-5' exonuclease [Syntrophales bacterium]
RRTAALYGMAGVANCVRFCGILNDLDEGTPQGTLDRFERLSGSFYEPADPTAARSPVQMMTVHRAKGLEFDVVILPFMDWKPFVSGAPIPPYLTARMPGKNQEHLVATAKDRRDSHDNPLCGILWRLDRNRRWGEAKRLFYVAATRARSRLIMTGVMKINNDCLSHERQSPLDWIVDHENLNWPAPGEPFVHRSGNFFIKINPHPPETQATEEPAHLHHPIPEPRTIEPEMSTLSVRSPSMEGSEPERDPNLSDRVAPSGGRSPDAIRGTVIHRLLKRGIESGRIASMEAVRRALVWEGLQPDEASRMAPGILKEAIDTLASPIISGLLEKARGRVRAEWRLECPMSATSLISGSIDLAAFDGTSWWIIDFKTGEPAFGMDAEQFISSALERYVYQINSYRELVRGFTKAEPTPIRAGIYFTALGRWLEIEELHE